jgi:hypothetical protein
MDCETTYEAGTISHSNAHGPRGPSLDYIGSRRSNRGTGEDAGRSAGHARTTVVELLFITVGHGIRCDFNRRSGDEQSKVGGGGRWGRG